MALRLTLAAIAASAAVAGVTGAQQPAPPPPPSDTPPADASASPVLPVSDCEARFALIGAPRHRGDDPAGHQTLICRAGYFLSSNGSTLDPDWVMEYLTPDQLKASAKRSNKFMTDTALPDGARAVDKDYAGSGYDRGHQAPAGDASFSQPVMDQSFYFSNMAPQVGIGFNRGAWKYLEETVRAWVMCGGRPKVFVITGPIYQTGDHPLPKGSRVQIPSAFYKIVYDVGSQRAVGFVLPNKVIGSRITLQDYVKPIADIEAQTGLAFFQAFDLRTQDQLETSPGTAWGHVAGCKSTAET